MENIEDEENKVNENIIGGGADPLENDIEIEEKKQKAN